MAAKIRQKVELSKWAAAPSVTLPEQILRAGRTCRLLPWHWQPLLPAEPPTVPVKVYSPVSDEIFCTLGFEVVVSSTNL